MTTLVAEKKATPPFAHGQLQYAIPHGSKQPDPPTHAQIAQRAFDLYITDCRRPGQCQANWYQAEKQLNYEFQGAPKPEAQFSY